jgi:hypothetical protein
MTNRSLPAIVFGTLLLASFNARAIAEHGGNRAQQPLTAQSAWKPIEGTPGSDSRYGSGFIDLTPVVDFMHGEKLKLQIGGSAKKVVLRMLPAGANPNEPVGIVGTFAVPSGGVLIVTLDAEHPHTKQISVHGGPNPWGMYPLGGSNGAATLETAARSR